MPDQPQLETHVVERPAASESLERSPEARAADHAAIAASIDDLLPALIAKLGATGLAELEVREDALRVRLRRPPEGAVAHDPRAGDRTGRGDRSRGMSPSGPASHGPGLAPVGPGRDRGDGRDGARSDQRRAVATSPAVGIYHPRAEARAGTRVRAGDRVGSVDMLGVPQEVVAPRDGLIGASLVESGDAVEYGQELVVIEFAGNALDGTGAPSTSEPVSVPAVPAAVTPPTAMDH